MSGVTSANPIRQHCVYAMPCLRKNKTYLIVFMTIGVVLAGYAYYNHSNATDSSYLPALNNILNSNQVTSKYASKIGNMARGAVCETKETVFGRPMFRATAIITGALCVVQLIILGVYSRSLLATRAIIGLSVTGLVLSLVCMTIGVISCRTFCMCYVGLPHLAIVYLGLKRLNLLKNSACPMPAASRPSSVPLSGMSSAGHNAGHSAGHGTGHSAGHSATGEKNSSLRRRPLSSK